MNFPSFRLRCTARHISNKLKINFGGLPHVETLRRNRPVSNRREGRNRKIHHLKASREDSYLTGNSTRDLLRRSGFFKETNSNAFRFHMWTSDSWILSSMKCVFDNWMLASCLADWMNGNEYWLCGTHLRLGLASITIFYIRLLFKENAFSTVLNTKCVDVCVRKIIFFQAAYVWIHKIRRYFASQSTYNKEIQSLESLKYLEKKCS